MWQKLTRSPFSLSLFPDFIYIMFFFFVRGSRPGKTVQMSEAEVRGLCLKSRELFLQQPILLELEAPLKICGLYLIPTRCTRYIGNCDCVTTVQ